MKQEILNSKKEVLNKMALMKTFKAIWAEDQKSNQFKLIMEGALKGKTMAKGVLTEIDKLWIADLITTSITTAIKPIQEDLKNVKENIVQINQRLDRIENCPTVKKELETNLKKTN